MTTALVIGSGPNGLAGAIRLAESGVAVTVVEAQPTIGGGTRTEELTVPGLRHDVCSAVHPFAAASPYLRTLPLADHGLEWVQPEIHVAHPLDDGSAGAIGGTETATPSGIGADAERWQRLFGPIVDRFDEIAADALAPVQSLPARPVPFVRFGLRAAPPATLLAKYFSTPQARALFAGNAAHTFRPLGQPLTSAIGVLLTAAAHAVGWPVAAGGSSAIAGAMAAYAATLGAQVATSTRVTSVDELRDFDIVLFDTSPQGVVAIGGAELPRRVVRALRRWRYGPSAFKLDLAIEGDIPWTAEPARRAGTVHLGGTLDEIAAAERLVAEGRIPERPFTLVGQQYVCDRTRSVGSVNPIWLYAHAPAGYDGDATPLILDQVERFAPGFRDRIVATHVMGPSALEDYNPNYVGGDILSGANTVRQLVARPRVAFDSHALGVPGWAICSASAPPGAGVHGMCGFLAAESAMRTVEAD